MASPLHGRMVSVDFLRGATVAFMIVANNPGDAWHIYGELIHAKWHGWTAVDLIFPTFLFLVGVSVALAAPRARSPEGWPRAFRRAGILFGLGLVVNAFPFFELASLRIPGVLQRIAVVYLAVLWLHLRLGGRALAGASGGILAGYWALWALVPVPGLGRPSMDTEYNLQGWLDQMLMRGHIWEYDTPWDPEGVLSTLPCVAIGLMGVLAGRWLRRGGGPDWTVVFLAGLSMNLGGLAWNQWFPINKVITTSSFALFVGGIDVMLVALAHRLLDAPARAVGAWSEPAHPPRIPRAGPVVALGRNALLVYVVSQFVSKTLHTLRWPFGPERSLHAWLFDAAFSWMPDRQAASLGWAVAVLAAMTLAAMALDRRGVVVRL